MLFSEFNIVHSDTEEVQYKTTIHSHLQENTYLEMIDQDYIHNSICHNSKLSEKSCNFLFVLPIGYLYLNMFKRSDSLNHLQRNVAQKTQWYYQTNFISPVYHQLTFPFNRNVLLKTNYAWSDYCCHYEGRNVECIILTAQLIGPVDPLSLTVLETKSNPYFFTRARNIFHISHS